jgi:hypothetical protein
MLVAEPDPFPNGPATPTGPFAIFVTDEPANRTTRLAQGLGSSTVRVMPPTGETALLALPGRRALLLALPR